MISFTRIAKNFFGSPPDPEYLQSRIAPADLEEHPLMWPPEAPYALALIRIDGSDSAFLHMVTGDDIDQLVIGSRVKAIWKEEPEGYLLDLERFSLT